MEPFTGNSKKSNKNPIKQDTERCVKMTNNHTEYSFQQKKSYPKKIPSSPEERNKKKKKIQIDNFFQNASILPDGTDSEGITFTKPAYQTYEENGNNYKKK